MLSDTRHQDSRLTAAVGQLARAGASRGEVGAAASQEQARLLDLMATKLETLQYDLGGVDQNIDRVKTDLQFVRKGYQGMFDLVDSLSGPRHCRPGPQLTSLLQSLAVAAQGNTASLAALQAR